MAGLTEHEAQVRLRTDGENALAQGKRSSVMRIFLGQFRDCMVMILLAATVLSALLGEITDAVTIILIVLLNAILGFVQEYRTERTLETLRNMTAPEARVCRDGVWKTIPARLLVCGDLIKIEAGDSAPADCALTEAAGLAVNESVLTGESEPVSKKVETPAPQSNELHQKGVLYAGTGVLRGSGQGIVIATGIRTQMGQISDMLEHIEDTMTPLQKRLAGLGKIVAILCIAVCILVFLAGVLRGEPLFDMLMTGITIAIAAIPEGLPATVTIALALAVSRMMKENALVNRLHSVETLGCASVICSDKTGTITENRMTVTEIHAAGQRYTVTDRMILKEDAPADINTHPALKELLLCGVLCSTAELTQEKDGTLQTAGDPTETALLVAALKAGFSVGSLRRQYPQSSMEPFDSQRKMMCVTVQHEGNSYTYVKGAADVLLQLCRRCYTDTGVQPLTAHQMQKIQQAAREMSAQALRVLGFAMGTSEQDLIFLGLSGMQDPPRASAKTAIRLCARARIRTVMITGDHPETAAAIARQAGVPYGSSVMTGAQLDALSDAELVKCVEQYGVFARVNPAHKLRLVRAYQAKGAVVAMTGDGVNDAPAMKAADVGVAMGKNGTDVARQAADVVLLDDNFATLVRAVEQGRCVYANIRKFVRYLLSCNIGEVVTMFVGILMGMPVVLLPTQLLLVNLVTDGLPAIALGLEPPEPEQMHRPPRKPDEGFFSDGLLRRIGLRGILIGLCTLGAFSMALRTEGSLTAARTAALCTLILSQLVHVFECKSETKSLLHIPYGNNKKLIGAVLLSLGVLLAAVQIPVLQVIFSTVALSTAGWLCTLAFSLAVPLLSAVSMRPKKTKGTLHPQKSAPDGGRD